VEVGCLLKTLCHNCIYELEFLLIAGETGVTRFSIAYLVDA